MKSRTFFIFWPLLVWLMLLLSLKSLRADVDENALWSLQFKNVSISEALRQITQTTGIKIIPPSRLGNQVITRSYKNQSIEYILKDIFRDMNYALVWSHGERGIDTVRILALDKVGASGATHSSDAVRPDIRDYPAARYPARRQTPPRRGPSPPTRSVEENEPEEADSEVSAEQEQEEEERAEAESKEEDKEELSSSGDSDEEKPAPLIKLPAQSDEEAEKASGESPSPVGQSKEEGSESSSPGEEAPAGGQ